MDSRLDFESERVSPGFFGEVDLGSKPGLVVVFWEISEVGGVECGYMNSTPRSGLVLIYLRRNRANYPPPILLRLASRNALQGLSRRGGSACATYPDAKATKLYQGSYKVSYAHSPASIAHSPGA